MSRLGELALYRILQDINMLNLRLVKSDPNYHQNREIYNQIVTGETDGLPQ